MESGKFIEQYYVQIMQMHRNNLIVWFVYGAKTNLAVKLQLWAVFQQFLPKLLKVVVFLYIHACIYSTYVVYWDLKLLYQMFLLFQ